MKFIPEQEAADMQTCLKKVFYLEIVTTILHYLYYFVSDTSTEENCITYQWQKIDKEFNKFLYPHLQALYPLVNKGYKELDHAFGELILQKSNSDRLLRWGLYFHYREEDMSNRLCVGRDNCYSNNDWVLFDTFVYFRPSKQLYYRQEEHYPIPEPRMSFPIFDYNLSEIQEFFPKHSSLDRCSLSIVLYADESSFSTVWRWYPGHNQNILFVLLGRIFVITNCFQATYSWCQFFASKCNVNCRTPQISLS